MQLDLPALCILAPVAVLIAGLSKGGLSPGAAFVATPLLALALSPAQAAAVMLPLLMLMDVTGLRAFWRQWDFAVAAPVMIGVLPGIGLGWLLFGAVDPDVVRLLLGLLALGFGTLMTLQRRGVRLTGGGSRAAGLFWGSVGGFTSFISHSGAPPVSIHLLGARFDKTRFQATMVLIFWWINAVKLAPYFLLGLYDRETLGISAALAPVAFGGVLLGVWGHRRLPEKWFFLGVQVLLALAGVKLIHDGATGLWG